MVNATLINGVQLKYMFIAGSIWLKAHISQINASNVFPVPDGDTGTNMFLTLQAALEEIHDYPGSHAGQLAALVSHGALMGARGNSGVILSQMLEGFSEALRDKEVFSVKEFALALKLASNKAYKAVMHPVEGTILTVIKETAIFSQQLAKRTSQIADFLAQLLVAAKHTLKTTPDMLPDLKAAGVVDSGGQGLVYFLEGMTRYVHGLPTEVDEIFVDTVDTSPNKPVPIFATPDYPYDVQFLIKGQALNLAAIRQKIANMGDCPLVVGDTNVAKVHVHVADPGLPLSYGITQGTLVDVVVENMLAQYQNFSQTLAKTTANKDAPSIEVICVADGQGLQEIFKSLGAKLVISGGPVANPGVENFLNAIEQINASQILLLPNHKDIIPAAQQAGRLASKTTRVIPSVSIPQGINALLAFDSSADLKENDRLMKQALTQVQTIEIFRAARNTAYHGRLIQKDNFLAFLNGNLTATGLNLLQIILDSLAQLPVNSFELLTVYYGQIVKPNEADQLLAEIQKIYPRLTLELIKGNQPYYQYIISVE